METPFQKTYLRERLLSLLAKRSPSGATDLIRELGISQPTFSRLVTSLPRQVLSFGNTRNRRYALAREIPDVRQPIPVYEVPPDGKPIRRCGDLQAIGDRGFAFVSSKGTAFFDDLPWFLQNARPTGFLGRLVPRRHPEFGHPDDVRNWSADHVLRFTSRFGWDLPGAFIIGEDACDFYLRQADNPANVMDLSERSERYPVVVSDLLSFGSAGSSAAGEQPKFLATIRDGNDMTPVLVKFSPPTGESAGRRIADLLVAEHLALETLGVAGFTVPTSSILTAGERVFLDVKRFDRGGNRRRIGQVTQEVLDAEFAGTDLKSWTESAGILADMGVIPADARPRIRMLETFGRLIGNTDMHFGNLSFLMDYTRVTGLAPVYDMLPMHYYPAHGETHERDYVLPILGSDLADVARPALMAAIDFWNCVAGDARVSPKFQEISARNAGRLSELRQSVELLPL